MRTHLKIRLLRGIPERIIALEYESDGYISYAQTLEISNPVWESEPDNTDEVVRLLAKRGWHQIDIYDELDEARSHYSSEA